MTHYDVFNGDADGICALHQLRLAEPRNTVLVTGVKRDIALLKQVDATNATSVTVLDISFDKNREALLPLIAANIPVSYFDHHFAGDIPDNPHLRSYINTDANTCTGLIMNEHLGGAHLPWAVTAAFGDNLFESARTAAEPLNLSVAQLETLKTLGTLLNYNGYGSTLDDLYFPPAELYANVSNRHCGPICISSKKTMHLAYSKRATAVTCNRLPTPNRYSPTNTLPCWCFRKMRLHAASAVYLPINSRSNIRSVPTPYSAPCRAMAIW